MSFLFGTSRRDQVHLLSTLQSLHTTSIPGLAAALSWSDRKTERVLREVVAQTGGAVAYDPHRRTVSVRSGPQSEAVEPAAGVSGGWAVPAPASVASSPPAPAGAAAGPILPKEFGGSGRCVRCQVPLLAMATGEGAVCPKCGQITTRRAGTATGGAARSADSRSDAGASSRPSPPSENGRTVVQSGDRRSQELFAAWVTARPIPCPRCRSTLQHRGVGEYGCPSCGHRVAFETNTTVGTTARIPTGPSGPGGPR